MTFGTTLFDIANLIVSLLNEVIQLFGIDISTINLSIQLFSETPIVEMTLFQLVAIVTSVFIVFTAVKITWGICKKIFNFVKGNMTL